MAKTPEKPMILVTAAPLRASLRVVLIGAGGNGARVMPPLMQMLRPGDSVSVVDHDIVEDRNLARQHFTERDIGRPKALVLAERYRRPSIEVTAFAQQVLPTTTSRLLIDLPRMTTPHHTVVIGCVDNWEARAQIQSMVVGLVSPPRAYIDVGNETRGGQVLMSLFGWPATIAGTTPGPVNVTIPAFHAMPQLLGAQPWMCIQCGIQNTAGSATCQACQQPQASCGQHVDMQTVMVNHMAAAGAINCLSWLMLGIPFTSCGAFFSTLNTMQPIRLDRVGPTFGHIEPELTFADPAPEP